MSDRTTSVVVMRLASHPLTAVIGLAASLGILGWTVSSSYFLSDDFLNFAQASQMGFRAWVNGELFGHWLPARKALDWGLNASRPISWLQTVLVLLMFVGVAALLVRLVVLRLTGSGAWANLALVLLPLTAAVPGTVHWYAGAAQVIPAMACASAVILGVVILPFTTGWRTAGVLVLIAGSLGVGLLFDERTAIAAVLAPGLLLLLSRGKRLVIRLAVIYALVVPVLAVWYFVQSQMTGPSDQTFSDPLTIAVFLAKSIVQNAAPALLGWVTRPALWGEDALWIVGGAILVLIAVLVARARSRGRAAWAVLIWLVAVVLTTAPTALVRAAEFGVSGALEPRYGAMAMPFGTIALVYVLSLNPPLRVASGIATAVVASLVVITAGLNLANLHRFPMGAQPRAWAEQLVASAQEQGLTHFYNTPVPGFVVPSAFYPYNLTGAVVPQIIAGADTVVAERTAGLVTEDGTVEVVTPTLVGQATLTRVEGFEQAPADGLAGCYVAGSAGGRLSFDAPDAPAHEGVLVVEVTGEFTDTGMRLVTGPNWDELRDKTASIGGSPPVAGSRVWVTTEEKPDMAVIGVDVQPEQSVCLDGIDVGTLPKTD